MLTEIRLEECELDCAMIGKRVRDARKAKKVTQEELSEHCGCTPPTSVILKTVKSVFHWNCSLRSAFISARAWTIS